MAAPTGIALPQLSSKVLPSVPLVTDKVYKPGLNGEVKFTCNKLVKLEPPLHEVLDTEAIEEEEGDSVKSLPFATNEVQIIFSESSTFINVGPLQVASKVSLFKKGGFVSTICDVEPLKLMIYPPVLPPELLMRITKVCPATALMALLNEPPPAP